MPTTAVRSTLSASLAVMTSVLVAWAAASGGDKTEDLEAQFSQSARTTMWVSAPLADLHACASSGSKILESLQLGTAVYVFDEQDEWVKVKWYSMLTVLNAAIIDQKRESSDSLASSAVDSVDAMFRNGGWVIRSALSTEETRITDIDDWRRRAFLHRNPEIPQELKDGVLEGEIVVGMTLEMLKASIGFLVDNKWLESRRVSVGEQGTRETLRYVYEQKGELELVFDNDVLSSFSFVEY